MGRCHTCRALVFFRGIRDNGRRYCNENCRQLSLIRARAEQMPVAIVRERVWEVQRGNCPECAGRGPLDIHTSYWVWSALFVTRWGAKPALSCRPCGTKRQLLHAGSSLVLGWWGFPWGFLLTPLQLSRNVIALFRNRDGSQPSPRIEKAVRERLAFEEIAAEQQRGAGA